MAERLTKRTKSGCPDIEFSRFPTPRDLMSGYADIYIKLCDLEDAEDQRSNGCEYCGNSLFSPRSNLEAEFENHLNKIRFCPMCGRKLAKEGAE